MLTYGGVSLFVVVFAVYPFAAEMFRQSDIPKRLIPGTIALGAFTFTMDSLPGTPQIQNIIPTTFFKTTTWAAPWLGDHRLGLHPRRRSRLSRLAPAQCRRATAKATAPTSSTSRSRSSDEKLVNPLDRDRCRWSWSACSTRCSRSSFRSSTERRVDGAAGRHTPVTIQVGSVAAIWAVEGALLVGILCVLVFAFRPVMAKFADGTKAAVAGALLASMNTASEYGFGGVIAALPGFLVIADALRAIPNPLVNEAITVTALAGITGSASGGMSIALAAMSDTFIEAANAAHIPLEVLHRVAAMASGGMDTLPHNGAVITLLAVTGLTHRTVVQRHLRDDPASRPRRCSS